MNRGFKILKQSNLWGGGQSYEMRVRNKNPTLNWFIDNNVFKVKLDMLISHS